ncbi:hypothetical protein B0A78_05150 [Flavobacterium columnare NBRC 100251 = ATCC 23463]|nr:MULTISPECIES: hypothetical protein [Flavobacterium]AMA49650.1 hypothetical protein AWN65_09350 [Flavobacterium covae]AND63346.1 hypothetical protein AX766_02360 [Flavobacterium covae]ANO47765.1 hypothetical protein Pf1_02310 [Flavobacterium columnare]APT21628.1 hypothetical protein BU993_02635 [Flavobacterium columnare]AUX19334.1 hypothetical protein AQ623_14475 [Flavobacterium columnare]
MKGLYTILAFLILLRPVMPVIDYVVNYNYIAEVLCVNKDKPTLECNGKCHLMKELAKVSETEKPTPDKKNNLSERYEILFCQSIFEFEFIKPIDIQIHPFSNYTNWYQLLTKCSILKPPIFR